MLNVVICVCMMHRENIPRMICYELLAKPSRLYPARSGTLQRYLLFDHFNTRVNAQLSIYRYLR